MHVLDQTVTEPITPRIRPGAPADAETLVALLCAAFRHDPVMEWVMPDPGRRDALMPGFFRAFYDLCLAAGGVDTVDGLDAVLLSVGPDRPAGFEAFPDLVLATAKEYGEALRVVLDRQELQRPVARHRYIAFGGVAPGSQRRGRAGALLAAMLRGCDETSTPVYTETSSRGGEMLARRFGFVRAGEDIRLPNGPTLRPMWREPRVRAS